MSQDEFLTIGNPFFSQVKVQMACATDDLLREIEETRRNLQIQMDALAQMQQSLAKRVAGPSDVLNANHVPVLTLNAQGCIGSIDDPCADLLGESCEKILGHHFSFYLIPEKRESWGQIFRDTMAGGGQQTGELALQRFDGAIIDIRFDCVCVPSGHAAPTLHMALTDISEIKLVEQELRRMQRALVSRQPIPADDWLHGIIEQSLAGIYLIQQGKFVYANQGFADIFGYASVAELVGTVGIEELIMPEDRAKVVENIRRRAMSEVPEMRYTFAGLCKDGRRIEVEVHGRRMLFGGEPAVIGVIIDITERRHAEQQVRIAAAAFESREGMFVTDASRVILRVNEAFSSITGFLPDEAIGQTPSLLRSERHDVSFYTAIWDHIARTGTWQGEHWSVRKSGELYPQWLSLCAVKDDGGVITNYVGTLSDMTARKAAEAEIEYLAFYDQLTRLPNRRLLLDRLQHALSTSLRGGNEGALLFIDLDNFKDLNDTLGHEQGDLLLKQVAERLSACSRDGDTVARVGGDEFVMMVEGLSKNSEEAAAQSKAIGEKILFSLNQPYALSNQELISTPSIGITLFSNHQNTVEELLKRADLAMYRAKDAGRNTLRFFDPEMQAAVTARTSIESDLRIGLREKQFQLYYQPQVGPGDCLTGVEALVRWQHPRRGLVAPSDFIPIAESSGLILPLGQWVLERACQQLVAWANNAKTSHLTMAVNVSARQFHHPNFVKTVLAAIESSGANPYRLKLELTESLLLSDLEDVIHKMKSLKCHGVSFSLDDFGTGYSSLAYLKRLPLDQLKIDKSFVDDLLTDIENAAITNAIVALANNLSLSVIAEGVEYESQRQLLANQGCLGFQGYYFGRPERIEVFEHLFKLEAS